MKRNLLLQWIEAAEARSVCVLAEEDPTQATIMPVMANVRPFECETCGNSFASATRANACHD